MFMCDRLLPTTAYNLPTRKSQVGRKASKLPSIYLILLDFFGSGGRDRTYDQLINSQLLYR